MKNKAAIIFVIVSIYWLSLNAQITNFKEKFELPAQVSETSGLLLFKGKILTHNDSGDAANLYEIDSLTGNLLRTITIQNANHVDWEDIAEDDTHIYIGDFGNNNGNRTDLKIYKILKSDVETKNSISAEQITFSYEDQTDFTSKPNNNNFDAEAMIVLDDFIFIFTKNWVDLTTNVYKIPKTANTYSAIKVSNANVQGLVTGATFYNNNIMLCGYDTSGIAFLVLINNLPENSDDFFKNDFEKYFLISELGFGNQVEGITAIGNEKFYISREAVNNNGTIISQKLFQFTDSRTGTLSTKQYKETLVDIYPNPTKNVIKIQSSDYIKETSLYSILGKNVMKVYRPKKELDISNLQKGVYLLKITFDNGSQVTRKVIKL